MGAKNLLVRRRPEMTKRDEYNEYLKSPSWIAFRDSIMDSKPDCQRCENRAATDLHHVIYRHELSLVRATDVLPLCRTCHNAAHRAIRVGLIRKPSAVKDPVKEGAKTLRITDEKISRTQSALQKKEPLGDEVILRINKLWDSNSKRRCLGILKTTTLYGNFSGYRRRKLHFFLRWAEREQKKRSRTRISKIKNPPKNKRKFKS